MNDIAVFTARFITLSQMMTPLLYCTCMSPWSVVNLSINSHEYRVDYIYIGYDSLTN